MNAMRVWAAAGALAAGVLAGWVADAPGAHAAGCASMTLGYSVPSGSGVVLVPQHVSVAYGGCVVFTNQTATTATVTVGGGYHASVAGFGGSATYPGRAAGRHDVTATSGPATAGGSITVAPPSSAPPRGSATAHRQRSHAAAATPTRPKTPSGASARPSASGPQVAGRPKRMKPPGVPSGTPTPPAPSPAPQAAPSSPAAAVVAGPLEPPSGRGIGLPAALAALAVVGTGAGLVRVLLAETNRSVDGGEMVGGTA